MKAAGSARRFVGLLLLVAPGLAQGQVWVVDVNAGPGHDFTNLNDAFWGSGDGDVLLVRPGVYRGLGAVADDRAVSIVADGGSVFVVPGNLYVQNLSASKRVVMRGIGFGNGTVRLQNNAGIVWFEDCTFLADQQLGSGDTAALVVDRSRLVLRRAHLHGSLPYGFYGFPPTDGLALFGSTAAVAGLLSYGGDGRDTSYPDYAGGAGISAWNSTLWITSAELRGGSGYTQPGGIGLELRGDTRATQRAVTAFGGSGTPAGAGTSVDGTSTLTTRPQVPHDLTTTSPVRVGQMLTVSIQGTPGEAVLLRTCLRPALAPDPAGPFRLVDPGAEVASFLGLVPAGGTLTLGSLVPDLGPYPSLELFLQAWHLGSRGPARREPGDPSWRGSPGPGSTVLLLGAGY